MATDAMPGEPDEPAPAIWSLYLLRTRRDSIYTGIATDVERRLAEHEAGGRKGARSLRGQAPLQLEYVARLGDQSTALRAEARIKRLPKAEKEQLIADALEPSLLLAKLGLVDTD